MRIGVIGTGRIGSSLGGQWAAKGHEVFFGSREPEKAAGVAAEVGGQARGGTILEAVAFGEVVLLAIPWAATADVIHVAGSLVGKTLIDCTNPITRSPEGMSLAVGGNTSAAEEIAKLARGAHVVKAFNTIYSHVIHAGPQFGSSNASVFFCGDHDGAKEIVGRLAQEIGFDPVDAGPLRMARFIEPFALLIIQLQFRPGMSSDMAVKLLRR
jgi:NADPH-dependent F420 reductase